MVHPAALALLTLDALLVASLVLGAFRLREILGLAPLYVTLGALQLLQTLLAESLYLHITDSLLVSPGSVVLFPANLFAVLLVYVREDATEARRLIHAIVGSNVAVMLLLVLFGAHLLAHDAVELVPLAPQLFAQNPRLAAVGTMALYLDVILVVLAYEALSRRVRGWLWLRTFGALAATLLVDSVVFAVGGFAGTGEFASIFLSSLVGKSLAALLFGTILAAWLRLAERAEYLLPREDIDLRGILDVLTFRRAAEAPRQNTVRDRKTRLYHRAFLDDVLPAEVERSQRFGLPVSVLRIRLDGWKAWVAKHGRAEADRALLAAGAALTDVLRASDVAARWDEDELAVLLGDADLAQAAATSERLRARLAEFCRAADPPLPALTVTVGAASWPEDATSVRGVQRVAEERLRAGCDAGGNRVIAAA